MSKELFNQPDQCHPIMPYEPVKNRLSFFRISLFDYEFDDLDVDLPGPPKSSPYAALKPRFYRLSFPIGDLFPEILPEVPTALVEQNGQKIRVGSNGTFLPAATVNRRYESAMAIRVEASDDSLIAPEAYGDVVKGFRPDELIALDAGQAVTRISEKKYCVSHSIQMRRKLEWAGKTALNIQLQEKSILLKILRVSTTMTSLRFWLYL